METEQIKSVVPNNEKVMSVKDWLKTLILMVIPFVNIIFLFVWAFSSDGNLNRKNWAKAQLIVTGIVLILEVIFFIIFFSLLALSENL